MSAKLNCADTRIRHRSSSARNTSERALPSVVTPVAIATAWKTTRRFTLDNAPRRSVRRRRLPQSRQGRCTTPGSDPLVARSSFDR